MLSNSDCLSAESGRAYVPSVKMSMSISPEPSSVWTLRCRVPVPLRYAGVYPPTESGDSNAIASAVRSSS